MYDGKKICSIEAPTIARTTKANKNFKNLLIGSPYLSLFSSRKGYLSKYTLFVIFQLS